MTLLASWRTLTATERCFVALAALTVGAATIGVRIVPFGIVRRAVQRIAWARAARHSSLDEIPLVRSAALLERIARRMAGARGCLPQALAGQVLLARAGTVPTLHLGVRRDVTGIHAHAWLCVADRPLLGARSAGDYLPLHLRPAAEERG